MKWTALPLLALAACNPDTTKPEDASTRYDREHVPGRYQASPDAKGDGVYVVDTRTGSVSFCIASSRDPDAAGFQNVETSCTKPSDPPQ